MSTLLLQNYSHYQNTIENVNCKAKECHMNFLKKRSILAYTLKPITRFYKPYYIRYIAYADGLKCCGLFFSFEVFISFENGKNNRAISTCMYHIDMWKCDKVLPKMYFFKSKAVGTLLKK